MILVDWWISSEYTDSNVFKHRKPMADIQKSEQIVRSNHFFCSLPIWQMRPYTHWPPQEKKTAFDFFSLSVSVSQMWPCSDCAVDPKGLVISSRPVVSCENVSCCAATGNRARHKCAAWKWQCEQGGAALGWREINAELKETWERWPKPELRRISVELLLNFFKYMHLGIHHPCQELALKDGALSEAGVCHRM